MNISKTMISVALSAMLLVQGCGGGGGSAGGDGTPSTELGNVQVPANSEERTALYNEKVAEFSDQAAKVRRELDSMLSDVSHNYSVMPEDIATDDYDRFRTRMNAALPDYAKLLLLANDVATIESQMAGDVTRKAQPRFIFGAILVTSVVVGMAGMYKWAIDSNNERIHIIVKAIANATPKELEEYNVALGIDRKSSKQEALSKFNNLGFRQAEAMVKRMEDVINVNVANGSDEKYATQLKDQSVKTVEKAAAVAVTTVIGQVLTAAGGQGVDKAISGAARLLGASAADAALIGATADLVISAEGKAPLDIIANNITVVEQAKEWYEENVEASKKMVQDALTIIQKVAEGDIPDALGIGDLVDSANSMMQNVALKSGQGEKNSDGSVTVKIPYRKSITTVKKVKNEDTKIPVSQMSDANVIVVAEGKKPEIKENVSVVGETTIEVEAKELKVVQKGMTVNASKVSSDQDSITYNVTATLTGVTEPTTVKISLSNASTGSSSKTLSKDGSVSWIVTVLDKDASVTITRMDNAVSSYLSLKGTGNKPVDIYDEFALVDVYYKCTGDGGVTETDPDNPPEMIGILGSSLTLFTEEVSISGYISQDSVDVTTVDGGETLHYTGTLASGSIDGNIYFTVGETTYSETCKGTYHGHYASLNELKQMKIDCENDSDCRNSEMYQMLVDNIKYRE